MYARASSTEAVRLSETRLSAAEMPFFAKQGSDCSPLPGR